MNEQPTTLDTQYAWVPISEIPFPATLGRWGDNPMHEEEIQE
jgi:hypothetical protein